MSTNELKSLNALRVRSGRNYRQNAL